MIAEMSLSQLAIRFGGTLFHPDCRFGQVSTDSRNLDEGALFVALRGERFDAHQFLATVAGKACGLVVEQPDRSINLPQWVVADTTLALGDVAREARAAFTGKLIGLTGSSGKTSVKEMIAAILGQCGSTLATKGNRNNHIGVPLTLLSLAKEHRFAVIEMGASGPGEIDYLTHIARPDIALVNNVMPAHVGGFGSLAAIAETKGAIYNGLSASGTAVLNRDEPWYGDWCQQLSCASQLSFSLIEEQGDFYPRNLVLSGEGSRFELVTPAGTVAIDLPLPGRHSVANSLAAAACTFAAGASRAQIASGLASLQPVKGRLQKKAGCHGATVLDDTYNANPGSVKAAIDVLASYPGQRLLVLGDMAELGDEAVGLHREVGLYARMKGIERVLLVGNFATAIASGVGDSARIFADKTVLSAALKPMLAEGVTVLVKGSRSSAMEEVVNAIVEGEH